MKAFMEILENSNIDDQYREDKFSVFAAQDADDSYSLTLSIENIHCASCVQRVEKALKEHKEVLSARVNMTTERLTYSWKGTKSFGDFLANIVINLGYDLKPFGESIKGDSKDQEKLLLRCLAVAGFAMGNLMMISIGLWSEKVEFMGAATQDFLHWISAIIALPAIIYSGRPFFHSAIKVLNKRHTNMDVPISLAIILASTMSLFETINHGEYIYFDSAVMLLFFLLIGRYLDNRAKGKAKESAKALLAKLQGTATVLKDNKRHIVPIRDIREGMTILVASGESIPVDGKVSKGTSEVDMSLITGETIPKLVNKGDSIFAGTINIASAFQLIASKASEESLLGDIITLMEKSERSKSRYVRIADKAASLYTPIVHIMGLLTFLGWLSFGISWQLALLNAVTVLIITCPCALGLAVPVAQVLAGSKLFKSGILLKSGDALEKLAAIDTVILDKTGTLTLGKPELIEKDYKESQLQIAASLAVNSKHPLSQAISMAYSGELLDIKDAKEFPGLGVQGLIDGREAKLGRRQWCGNEKGQESDEIELWLSINNEKICFKFIDILRKDAKNTVNYFQNFGYKVILLSGDSKKIVSDIANKVGISDYYAETSPIDKCEYIETLKDKGAKILMVGDGLNDAPSLSSASISMSPSSAIDITQNTADIVFQGEKLKPIIKAFVIANKTKIIIKENFMIAIFYNIIAIPLAMFGYVTPLIAAIAMSSSSLVVVFNSFRLNSNRGG
jgi:Cu2+-exporting ATPase|tara:strand:+ start:15669 stop:17876 length:2208 start_codon:yes stop_codon:yes gene_type:complete